MGIDEFVELKRKTKIDFPKALSLREIEEFFRQMVCDTSYDINYCVDRIDNLTHSEETGVVNKIIHLEVTGAVYDRNSNLNSLSFKCVHDLESMFIKGISFEITPGYSLTIREQAKRVAAINSIGGDIREYVERYFARE